MRDTCPLELRTKRGDHQQTITESHGAALCFDSLPRILDARMLFKSFVTACVCQIVVRVRFGKAQATYVVKVLGAQFRIPESDNDYETAPLVN